MQFLITLSSYSKDDDVIKKILPWLNEWDFPVFEIEKITEGRRTTKISKKGNSAVQG